MHDDSAALEAERLRGICRQKDERIAALDADVKRLTDSNIRMAKAFGELHTRLTEAINGCFSL